MKEATLYVSNICINKSHNSATLGNLAKEKLWIKYNRPLVCETDDIKNCKEILLYLILV